MGNVACLLPWALILLAEGAATARPSLPKVGGFVLIGATKLFPFLWLWPFCLLRRWTALGYVAAAFTMVLGASFLSPPNATFSVLRSFVEETFWIVDSSDVRLGQPNVYAATLQLTRPIPVRYDRHGLTVDTQVSPVLPLSPEAATGAGLGLSLVGLLLSALWTKRVVARRGAVEGLWFFSTMLCVVLPVTNYPYLAVALPGIIASLGSPLASVRWLAVAAYLAIGLGRFTGYLVAAFPELSPMSSFAAAGPVLVCVAVYRSAAAVNPSRVE